MMSKSFFLCKASNPNHSPQRHAPERRERVTNKVCWKQVENEDKPPQGVAEPLIEKKAGSRMSHSNVLQEPPDRERMLKTVRG